LTVAFEPSADEPQQLAELHRVLSLKAHRLSRHDAASSPCSTGRERAGARRVRPASESSSGGTGSLIHASFGSFGGCGRRWPNRVGFAA
jgi:hypothetical protein